MGRGIVHRKAKAIEIVSFGLCIYLIEYDSVIVRSYGGLNRQLDSIGLSLCGFGRGRKQEVCLI